MKKTYFLLFVLLFLCLVKVSFIPNGFYPFIKIIVIFLVLLFLEKRRWVSKIKGGGGIPKWVLVFFVWVVLSTLFAYISMYVTSVDLIGSVIYVTLIALSYALAKRCIVDIGSKCLIDILFYILLVYYICSVISIVCLGVHPVKLIRYFAGIKFMTSYTMMLFCVLFAMKFKVPQKHRVSYLILAIITILLCAHIRCSTTTIASFLLLLVLSKGAMKMLHKKSVIVLFLLLSVTFALVVNVLIEQDGVRSFITETLGKQITLTGRTDIYKELISIISLRPLAGYGYGNTIVEDVVGYGNAQNGLLYIIVEFGLIGGIIVVLMIRNMLPSIEGRKNKDLWPLFVFLYILIFCSTVEVSLNNLFFLTLFIIHLISVSNKRKEEKELRNESIASR